ncbi:hypothetical protein KEM48_005828 [Puccinia striiformis f. sp. tritici PST-130]|nr:hypothetical protein KEM48_005828 [Puccinia striiformis f. sp. tritici PST-130]
MTPDENRILINHYLTVVKQQRANNPPPPPFVDPLTSDERLDGIIKTVLASQELKLDQQINFNRSLREYRANKKLIKAAYFKKKFDKLEKTLANDKSNPLHKANLATFNIRFEDYKDALIKAQEIEVQATQTRDETIIPTTKVLKIEYQPTQVDKLTSPIPEVTGNVHLDKHLAKTSITDKPVDKKEKTTKRKILPLDSPFGGSTISLFTTEPYFEDLKPTENLSSPVLKKIVCKPALPILLDSEDKLEEDLATPILNPSTRIPNNEPSKLNDPTKSSLQRNGERIREQGRDSGSVNHSDPHQKAGEDPRQVLEGDLERRQEDNLGSGSTEPARPPETHPKQGNQSCRPKSDKRNQPRQSDSNHPDRTHSNYNRDQTRPTNSRNQTRSNTGRSQGRLNNNNPRHAHLNNQGNNKRHRKESEDLEDEVRWAKVHRATAVHGAFFRHTKR